MTRDDFLNEILTLSDSHKYLILNLPTGFGKTRALIEIVKRHFEDRLLGCNILIVVPKNVLKDTWKTELIKWEFPQYINVTLTTYVSYPKYADTYWNLICFDEAQHFTEACEEVTEKFHYDRVVAMSATIPREPKWRLKGTFPGIKEYSVSAREAINNEILPDPKVLLVPLILDNTEKNQIKVIRKSKPKIIVLDYTQRRARFHFPNQQVHIKCTAAQYHQMLCEDIDWQKREFITTQQAFKKNIWLHTCKERLTWLAKQKEDYVLELLKLVEKYRTLTFCADIEQTEKFGKHPVNSKDKKESEKNLADFNERRINHITSCSILNEGVNISDCRIGIFANIGSSEVVEIQRLGRILRHKKPLIIIPYFVGTREEEIVEKMLKNYNENLVMRKFKSQINAQLIEEILDGES